MFINVNQTKEAVLDNKRITFENEINKIGLTIFLKNYIHPTSQIGLKYIENTSLIIEAMTLLGNLITKLPNKVKLSFEIPSEYLQKNIGIWHFNTITSTWEPMDSIVDNNTNTKYLNFDKKNAGVTVQLNSGRAVTGFTLTTANDYSGRDPTSYKLYGSNDGSTWTLSSSNPPNLSLT